MTASDVADLSRVQDSAARPPAAGELMAEVDMALFHVQRARDVLHYRMAGAWSPDLREAHAALVRFVGYLKHDTIGGRKEPE